MTTLISWIISIAVTIILCIKVDRDEAKEFRKKYGFTRRQAKKVAKMMRDSSFPSYKPLNRFNHFNLN